MGMYDRIMINVKCPYCEEISLMEAQNKEMSDELMIFNVGDNVKKYLFRDTDTLDCVTDCHSNKCIDFTNEKDGYISGFGRIFYLNVELKDGLITGNYTIGEG